MVVLRMSEIREMSPQELEEKIVELRAEITRQKTMVATGGAMEAPTLMRENRKAIARILTVQRERELREPQ